MVSEAQPIHPARIKLATFSIADVIATRPWVPCARGQECRHPGTGESAAIMQVDSGRTKCACVVAWPPRRITLRNPWKDDSHHGREQISRSSPSLRSEVIGQPCVVKDAAELLKEPSGGLSLWPCAYGAHALRTELERQMIFSNRTRC
jgi:hypothetical protein